MSFLNLVSQTVMFDDVPTNSNPKHKSVDWSQKFMGIPVTKPKSNIYEIEPGATSTIFDGAKVTLADNTTAYDLSLSPLDSNRYRITWTGGTAPAFRAARGITIAGASVSVAVNSNNSITLTIAGGNFTGSVVGDDVLIPGVVSGDAAGPFNAINTGYWTVIGVTTTTLTLARPQGIGFEAIAESAIVVADGDILVYATAGIQIGNVADILAGFQGPALKTYQILAVTPTWFEIQSTTPLAAEAGVVPGASGIQFYTAAKRFLRIEYDQECVLRFNGDTGSYNICTPWQPGDLELVGECVKVGTTWRLVVVNRTTATLRLLVISAE